MSAFFILLISLLSYGNPSWKWSHAVGLVEKHEFYSNNEVISKPKDSWQTLFAVLYRDSQMKTFKDCLFYYVPGVEAGRLKIKTIPSSERCEDSLYLDGDKEWRGLKALQYSFENNFLTLSMTNQQYQIERWDVPLFNVYKNPRPKALMSSAEYRSAGIIFLTPHLGQSKNNLQKPLSLKDKENCHNVSEDCVEKSPSVCGQCEHGWFEIPNGCSQGPKYCGSITCGTKNRPACRRGMKYQMKEGQFSCREDSSFAYCAKGLQIQCQGNLPYCI